MYVAKTVLDWKLDMELKKLWSVYMDEWSVDGTIPVAEFRFDLQTPANSEN